MTSKPLEEGSCHLWLEYLNQDMNGDEAMDFFDKGPLPAKIDVCSCNALDSDYEGGSAYCWN